MRCSNCPEAFYINCTSAPSKCRQCAAGSGGLHASMHYTPEEDIGDHPHYMRIVAQRADSRAKSKRGRDAKQREAQAQQRIAKQTLRSGALLGDGDHLLLSGAGDIRQEFKDRGPRKSWNLTWEEFQKGKSQQIGVYAIEIECPDAQRRTLYMMEEGLFTEFLALVKAEHERRSE